MNLNGYRINVGPGNAAVVISHDACEQILILTMEMGMDTAMRITLDHDLDCKK